ncbi:MAG TPA: hypothetical protein VFR27_12830 [Mycobacterium sp.]|nr:hypothetical protein [Mycobacterium sp.]
MSEVVGQDQSARPAVFRLWDRRAVFGPFALPGAISVIAGGSLAAAIAAPAPTRHGVWAAAYLVLVLGVGQIVLGIGPALLASTPPSARMVTVTATLFNIANIAILLGIVTNHITVFDAGSLLLLIALALFLHGVWHGARRGWPLYVYRLLVAVLAVSIPIGLLITTAANS